MTQSSKCASAFYQQRVKLSDDAFQQLFYNFNRHFKPKFLLRGRYQRLARDGAGFAVTRNPKDTESYYDPSGRSKKGYSQLYIPILTNIISVPYGRHFSHLFVCYTIKRKHCPTNGIIHAIRFKTYFRMTLYSYIQTVCSAFIVLN